MSLVVRISINDGPPVELIVARRTAGGEDPDCINSYAVQRFDTRDNGVRQIGDARQVLHRYGDGAAALATLALQALTTTDEETTRG